MANRRLIERRKERVRIAIRKRPLAHSPLGVPLGKHIYAQLIDEAKALPLRRLHIDKDLKSR